MKKINKIQALKIVRKNGLRLKELPSIFKKDKDVVLAAVKNDGFAIADADKSFLRDKKIAIEAIKEYDGRYLAYTDNGREYTGIDVFEWANKVDELGAGEIVITSVDNEGTGEGYDKELVSKITDLVSIPVIAHGGAGRKEDVELVIKESGADAVALSSILHYDYILNNILIPFSYSCPTVGLSYLS